MKLEYKDIGPDDVFDYCVIGSGPAGMACALTLAAAGRMRVLLLEGGGKQSTQESQQLYAGTTSGDTYRDRALTSSRLRYFGGTTNHWNGWCRTLDSHDFQRKGNTKTQWPIAKEDLDAHFREAADILDLPEVPADRPMGDSGLNFVDFVWAPRMKYLRHYFPVRILQKYYDIVVAHQHIFLLLNANVTQIETNGASVTSVRVKSFTGEERKIRAHYFVLAAGGIENSRLLLWSNQLSNGQLVKNSSTLGRYWMDHPHFTLGDGFIATRFFENARNSQRSRIFLSPTPALMAQNDILNCGLRVEELGERSRAILERFEAVAPQAGRRALELFDQNLVRGVRLRAAWEQEPVASNCITLNNETDALGVPRSNLHWVKNERDRRTVAVCARRFGEYLAREDTGRLRLDPWVLGEDDFPTRDEIAGPHHLGGTRMADTAGEGVVDRDCRVFGQSNLYIAGSSVFPSGGHANPTLTIVQLAVRLGHHLKAQSREHG